MNHEKSALNYFADGCIMSYLLYINNKYLSTGTAVLHGAPLVTHSEGGQEPGLSVFFFIFDCSGLFTQNISPGKSNSQGSLGGSKKLYCQNFWWRQYIIDTYFFF